MLKLLVRLTIGSNPSALTSYERRLLTFLIRFLLDVIYYVLRLRFPCSVIDCTWCKASHLDSRVRVGWCVNLEKFMSIASCRTWIPLELVALHRCASATWFDFTVLKKALLFFLRTIFGRLYVHVARVDVYVLLTVMSRWLEHIEATSHI